MQLIDSHCHLDFDIFAQDLPEVLERSNALGVSQFIVPGVRASTWLALMRLSEQQPSIKPALGLHPYFIAEHKTSDLEQLKALATEHRDKLVAIGEIGLDWALAEPMREKQLQLFEAQLALAQELELPVILHARKSHPELLQRLKQARLPHGGVVHAFSGSRQLAEDYLRLGYKLGVGGVITYPRANKTRQAIASLPSESLLLETDAPDMPLMGRQGARNSPEYLPQVLATLAELRLESAEDLAATTRRNTQALFQLTS